MRPRAYAKICRVLRTLCSVKELPGAGFNKDCLHYFYFIILTVTFILLTGCFLSWLLCCFSLLIDLHVILFV